MPRDDKDANHHHDLPELSNEDVAILYEIINVSSQSPDIQSLPFRAIFAAYDEVLAKHGISPAHDQLYLRFLFRLGERLGQTEDGEEKDFFTEFEALLLELGIKIEVESVQGSIVASEEISADDEGAENDASTNVRGFTDFLALDDPSSIPRRERRASFSEILDFEEEVTKAERELPDSPASVSRLQNTSDGFGSRPYTRKERHVPEPAAIRSTNVRRPIQEINNLTREIDKHPPHNVHNARAVVNASRPQRNHVPRNHQQERKKSIKQFEIYEDDLSEQSLPIRNNDRLLARPAPTPHSSRRPSSRLLKDAEVFDSFQIQRLARHIFEKWHSIVVQKQRQRSQMLLLAIQYDRRELMKQAWNEWFEKHKDKVQIMGIEKQEAERLRQAEEQDRYQQWREASATNARDVYLVSKAFSHWVNCASERAQENAVARRHLIRLRYFTAWKEVTAIHEVKVRRTVLGKFFSIWLRKLHDRAVERQEALIIHENSLLQRTYWHWFWQYCEQRAPEWHKVKLKRRVLQKWAMTVDLRAVHKVQTTESLRAKLQQRCFEEWRRKASLIKSMEEQAVLFRKKSLEKGALSSWNAMTQLAIPARQISKRVNKRIISATFSSLVFRVNLYQQAKKIDRKRQLRNVWSTWNDELRVQTMRHQIDDRLILQALYKWVLAERGALMKRVHDERLQQQLLSSMLRTSKTTQTRYHELEDQARKVRNLALARAAMSIWRSKYNQCQQQQEIARSFHIPRFTSPIMRKWHAAHQHQAQLLRWSVESAFYFRSKRSINKWRAASKESQKQKRRESYTVVKRTYNKNLARSAFLQWRDQAGRIQELQIREHDFRVVRAERLLSTVMNHWSERLNSNNLVLSQASSYDSTKIASTMLQLWAARWQILTANVSTASTFYEARIQKSAYDSVRQLQLKMLTLRTHNAKANSVLSWNLRRRARGLVRAWADRAASRRRAATSSSAHQPVDQSPDSGPLLPRGTPLISLSRTPRTNRRGQPFLTMLGMTNEQLVLPEIQPHTPFPNFAYPSLTHLNTPSSRTGRATEITQAQAEAQVQMQPVSPFPARQNSPREQSHTPPTAAIPRSRLQHRNLRFADEDTMMDSPLRVPPPKPIHEPTTLPGTHAPQLSFARTTTDHLSSTDILPHRAQHLSRVRPGGLSASITDTGAGAGAGVRRSLFPNARRIVRDSAPRGDLERDVGPGPGS